MPTQTRTFVPPFRLRSDAAGSTHTLFQAPAQPADQLKSQRSLPMFRNLCQRLDRAMTAVAMCGLLSPLLVGSFMFVVSSH